MLLVSFAVVLFFQDLRLQLSKTWEQSAKEWMTREELALYESITPRERELFKGFFVSRRLDDPFRWPRSGLFLPCFYYPQKYGDVRDRIEYLLGEPLEKTPQGDKPALRRAWRYPRANFFFETDGVGKARLAARSLEEWNSVLRTTVKHPYLRYDFQAKSFGRTRLPDDIAWISSRVDDHRLLPEARGARLHVAISIPEDFKDYLSKDRAGPVQYMEALVLLHPPGARKVGPLKPASRFRHATQRLNLLSASHIYLDFQIPPGHFDAEILLYSGFLQKGFRSAVKLTVLPPELPRIGDPIVCQEWETAAITTPEPPAIIIGNTLFKPTVGLRPAKPAKVLVRSDFDNCRAWSQNGGLPPVSLERVRHEDGWFIFDLPDPTRSTAVFAASGAKDSSVMALSAFGGPMEMSPDPGLRFNQSSHSNYLALERLEVTPPPRLTALFVNGAPVLASRDGRFPWPTMDWGPSAALRFVHPDQGSWSGADFRFSRNEVFEALVVKPKYIVAAAQGLDGSPAAVDLKVSVADTPVKITGRDFIADMPKLWGIVVNDPLLKSPSWLAIRQALEHWLRHETRPEDTIYIVHLAHRPELVLEPTRHKILALSALRALTPKTKDENYFTVQYLIDALTHLELHQTRPHQVLLLTHQLTDEASQMENLIPQLRPTGLQIYNLEFPFEFVPESEAKVANLEPDPLVTMAVKEEEYQRDRMVIKDNFQEKRNVTAGYSIAWNTKKSRKKRSDEQARTRAFHEAFNRQLANLTAGLAHSSGFGETTSSLHQFFQKFSQWQKVLVHLELPLPVSDDQLIKVQSPAGYTVSWTMVEWRVP